MKYRIKKNQLFRKKLNVPESILNNIYNDTLKFLDYVDYELEDKVPLSCLDELDRKIVEKFGIEKAKTIDWELIELKGFELSSTIDDISEYSENINDELYKFVRTDMKPKDYTTMMKNKFSEYVLEDSNVETNVQNDFNSGYLNVSELVSIWSSVKDKELSLCLKNDHYNKDNVTEEELKKFMDEYDEILSLFDNPEEIYSIIVHTYRKEEEPQEYIKQSVMKVLDKTINNGDRELLELSNEQYSKIFKYVSIKEYLDKKIGEEHADNLVKELNGKDINCLFELIIPFNILINLDVLTFIEIYGLNNLIHFEEESGPFFTRNNCELLLNMYDMYIKYGANETDKNKCIFTKNPYGITGNYIERPYTKEEFNEAIRRMIVYGPTNPKYKDSNIDYSIIKGEFRELNAELFIDKKLPEEFKKAFYTKSLTPLFVRDHYNCISYLIGKKLSTIFSPLYVKINTKEDEYYYRYNNVYEFLENKLGFEDIIRIITDYADVFDNLFGNYDKLSKNSYIEPIIFKENDTYEDIINKINDKVYELVIKANIKYSSNISKSMKEKYPNIFISYKAPQELHDKFYNREITAKYIIEHPEEKKYFDGLDIELFFNYMPIVLVSDDSKKRMQNLILFVKNLFDNEEGLDILLSYTKYLDRVNEKFGFSKVEFKDSITKEEFLVQIDCLIYLNILRGVMLYDEYMPDHFKAAYPSLFLTTDTPDEIKYKFYNRLFKLEDFYNNPVLLKHFANTDIAACLDITFSNMIGLFTSNEFLEIIDICGESIKNETKLFNFIRTKTENTIDKKLLGKYIFEYYTDYEETFKYLVLAKLLGVTNKKIEDLTTKYNKLISINSDLDIYSSSINTKLLSDSIIKDYGYDTILSLFKYNTNAYKVIIEASNKKDKQLKQWLDYLKCLPIYNEKLLHSALNSYNNMLSIISVLLENGTDLDNKQLIVLKDIILNNNKYNVTTLTNINNYSKVIKKSITDKIKSENIDVVRDGIFNHLFNKSLVDINTLFNKYGINNDTYYNEYINNLSLTDQAIIIIIKSILEMEDTDILKTIYEDIKGIELNTDYITNIDNNLRSYYSSLIKDSLYTGTTTRKESGLEQLVIDINDNYVLDDKEIDIVELDNDFNIIVYCLPRLNEEFTTDNMLLKNNPSMWNKLNNNILKMNLISNNNIGCIGHGNKNEVYYGFNNITNDSIIVENNNDIDIDYNTNLSVNTDNSKYMLPSILNNTSSSYNTIVVNIDTSNSNEYDHRIQPSYIVCFDNNINNESKLAAEYFNIPIYMINRDKYYSLNDEFYSKYNKEDISIRENDIKDILKINTISFEDKCEIILNNIDKDDTNLVSTYNKIISAYSIHNDIPNIAEYFVEGVKVENEE